MKTMNPLCFKTSNSPVTKISSIIFDEPDLIEMTNKAGESYILHYTIEPAGATVQSLLWSCEPDDGGLAIQIIGAGAVRLKAASGYYGIYTIIAMATDGSAVSQSVTCEVADTAIYITDITLTSSADSDNVPIGDGLEITATITPSDASIKTLSWDVNGPYELGWEKIRNDVIRIYATDSSQIGTYTVTAAATDNSDVKGTYQFSISIASSSEEEITERKATWRGSNLLELFDSIDNVAEAVVNGNFNYIWLGDYIPLELAPVIIDNNIITYTSYNLIVADINYFDSSPHLILIPDCFMFGTTAATVTIEQLNILAQAMQTFIGSYLIDVVDDETIYPGVSIPSIWGLTREIELEYTSAAFYNNGLLSAAAVNPEVFNITDCKSDIVASNTNSFLTQEQVCAYYDSTQNVISYVAFDSSNLDGETAYAQLPLFIFGGG